MKVDVVINLAGNNIFTLWSEAAKTEIEQSRVLTTRHLVKALDPSKTEAFISTSAWGYYVV